MLFMYKPLQMLYTKRLSWQDLQHPNEFIRGSTLRFLCKLKEPELLEPLMPAIRACLEHRHSYVRRNAVLAIYTIYRYVLLLCLCGHVTLFILVISVKLFGSCSWYVYLIYLIISHRCGQVLYSCTVGNLNQHRVNKLFLNNWGPMQNHTTYWVLPSLVVNPNVPILCHPTLPCSVCYSANDKHPQGMVMENCRFYLFWCWMPWMMMLHSVTVQLD